MPNRLKVLAVLGALVLLVASAAGCGGDDNSDSGADTTSTTSTTETSAGGGGGAAQTLDISADPSGALKFNTERLSAKPGQVTIKMDNPAAVDHAVSIIGNGVSANGNTVNKGGVSTVTADLTAGRYDFYCPVGGHQQAGMQGTLIVKK